VECVNGSCAQRLLPHWFALVPRTILFTGAAENTGYVLHQHGMDLVDTPMYRLRTIWPVAAPSRYAGLLLQFLLHTVQRFWPLSVVADGHSADCLLKRASGASRPAPGFAYAVGPWLFPKRACAMRTEEHPRTNRSPTGPGQFPRLR